MALKHFHIVLIACAILLGAGYGFWSLDHYRASGLSSDLWAAVIAYFLAAALAGYLVWFLNKARRKGW